MVQSAVANVNVFNVILLYTTASHSEDVVFISIMLRIRIGYKNACRATAFIINLNMSC